MNRPDPIRLLAQARPVDLDGSSAPPAELTTIMAHARRRPAAARSRRGFVLGLAGTAALAAVTVAAVAATQLGGPPGPSPRAEPPPRVLSASDLLLAAASRVEPESGNGRYWVHRMIDWRLDQARAATGDFVVVVRSRWESWSAMTTGELSWFINQPLSVRPATPADEEAWKRAGSPDEITLDGKRGRASVSMPVGEGRRLGYSVDSNGRSFSFGHGVLSLAEVRALPADPAQLRAALLRHRNPDVARDETAYLFDAASHLIVRLPVTSEVRAAAYRLLSGLPGIRAETGVKDVTDRAGVAVVQPDTDAIGGSLERWLIIDPGNGRALATEVRYTRPAGPLAWVPPGAVYQSRVVENAGWSNDAPPAP